MVTADAAEPSPAAQPSGTEQVGGEEAPAAAVAAPKPRSSNPFGAARPREDVLKEQGRDWRKEEAELAHKSIARYCCSTYHPEHSTRGIPAC